MVADTQSPMLYRYLKSYQENPRSRVFAPLAEAYRKAGLLDEAIEICREGLKIHPKFSGGKVAMARALFDRKNYGQVVTTLADVLQDSPDNLLAQRLVAESHLMIGNVTDALSAYKMLLYFNPMDAETARMVHELEGQAYSSGAMVVAHDFEIKPAETAVFDDPDEKKRRWMNRVERLHSMLASVQRYRATK